MVTKWNFLIVDDDSEILSLLKETFEAEGFLGDSVVSCTTVSDFTDALKLVESSGFDLIVLDLQDDGEDGARGGERGFSGERVLNSLKEHQFTPVVFHTGYADKIKDLESRFVKVVRKGAPDELADAVKAAFSTKLPSLIRHIQEEQRKYLWDHVENKWGDSEELNEEGEIAYLLARRLSSALSSVSVRKFFNPEYDSSSLKVLPVEYYIYPPLDGGVFLGDIFLDQKNGDYFLVINPACDFDQCKIDNLLFVKCVLVENFPEFSTVKDLVLAKEDVSKAKRKELSSLFGDNRKVSGGQPERYKYLPGTSFIPHLVADFQLLSQIQLSEFNTDERYLRVATLDTPFAEAVQAKFSRYYGRFGVPDLDFENIAEKIIASFSHLK